MSSNSTPSCQFCHQPTIYAPLKEMEEWEVKVYWCGACQAEYLYFQNSNFANSVSLYTTINERVYRWSVAPKIGADKGGTWLWYVKEPGIPGVKANKDLEMLFSSPDVSIEVTPQNIREKLSTFLLFL